MFEAPHHAGVTFGLPCGVPLPNARLPYTQAADWSMPSSFESENARTLVDPVERADLVLLASFAVRQMRLGVGAATACVKVRERCGVSQAPAKSGGERRKRPDCRAVEIRITFTKR
ncbi:hypothetical protein [Mesorhizobium sp. CN2-181]|uniref:hypothetical protein n=1 Tax=Mesorhizobium yinganensis TaxID=3157707 RepID=UPI0032B7ABC1